MEQYKQSIVAFDGLEANAEIDNSIEYERIADRPAWVNEMIYFYSDYTGSETSGFIT